MYLCTLLIFCGTKCVLSEFSGAPPDEELERLNRTFEEKRNDYICLDELLQKYSLLTDPDERIVRLMRKQLTDTNSTLEALRTQIEQIKAAAASSTIDRLYELFDKLKEKRKDYACRYEIYSKYMRIENPDKRVLELMNTQIRSVDSNIKDLIDEAENKKKDLERTGITIQSDVLEEFAESTETTPPIQLDEDEVNRRAQDMVNKYRREGNFITKDRMYDLYMKARDVVKAGGTALESADRQIMQLDRELGITPREYGFDVFVQDSKETGRSDTGSFRTFRRKIEQRGPDIYLGPTDMDKRPVDEDTAYLTSTGSIVEEQLTLGPFSKMMTPDLETYMQNIGLNELKRDLATNSSRSFNSMFRELLDEGIDLEGRKPKPTPLSSITAKSSRDFSISDGYFFRELTDKVKSQLLGMNSDFGDSDRSTTEKTTTKSILSKVRMARTRKPTQSWSAETVTPSTTDGIGFGALRDKFKVFLTSSQKAAKPVETETPSSFTIHEVGFDDLGNKFKVSFYGPTAAPPSAREKPRAAHVIPTERNIAEYNFDPDESEYNPLPSQWDRLGVKALQKEAGMHPEYILPSAQSGSRRMRIPSQGVVGYGFNSNQKTDKSHFVTSTVTVATESYGQNLGPSIVPLGYANDPTWKRLREELLDKKEEYFRKEADLDLCLRGNYPDGVKAALLTEDLNGLKRKLNHLEREIGEREQFFNQSTKKIEQSTKRQVKPLKKEIYEFAEPVDRSTKKIVEQESRKRKLNGFEKEMSQREEVVDWSTKGSTEQENRKRKLNGLEKEIGQRDEEVVDRSTKRNSVQETDDEVMQRYRLEFQKMKEEYMRQGNVISQYMKCKNPDTKKVKNMEQDLRNLRKYMNHLERQIDERQAWLADKGWARLVKTQESRRHDSLLN